MEKRPNIISQSESPALEEIVVCKNQKDTSSHTYYFSLSTVETGLTGGTRVNVTPGKRIPMNKKYIKSKAFSPFLPVNKILLNGDNDNNPETTDNSLSEKYDMSHTSPDDFTVKINYRNYK